MKRKQVCVYARTLQRVRSSPTRAVLEQTVFQAFADEFEVELQAAPTSSAERAAEATLETSFSATG